MSRDASATTASVLVVHEDGGVRNVLASGLTHYLAPRVGVETASSYIEAFDRVEAHPFDVVIFHLNLPDNDPFMFVEGITAVAPNVRLLAVTGGAAPEGFRTTPELACAALFRQPIDLGELANAVTDLIEGGSAARSLPRALQATKRPRVLVVDDDDLVRYTVAAALQSVADVESLATAVDAIDRLSKESFDVLFVDIKMDEMDGVTLLRHARRVQPDVVAVVMTGFPELSTAIAGFKERAYDYLFKPLEPELLRAALSRAYGQRVLNRQRHLLFVELQRALANVRSKAAELETAKRSLREILDHMRQALVVFGPDGSVEELRAAAAETVFGDCLSGGKVTDLLFDDGREWSTKRQLFDLWLDVAFNVGAEDWAEALKSAPTEVTLGRADDPKGKRWLELEFRPIFAAEKVSRVLLIATDVSEERRLAAEVVAQQTRYDAELAAMRRVIAGSGPAFADFLHVSEARFGEARRLLHATASQADAPRLLGIAHTMRGEARAFGLDDLAASCERLEAVLVPYQRAVERGASGTEVELSDARKADVQARILACEHSLASARELFVAASPAGRVALDQTTVRRTDVEWLERLVRGRGDEVEAAVRALTSRPFGESCAPIEGKATYWSEQEAKPLKLTIRGRDVAVPSDLAHVLRGVLAHLVRNSVAHGLETEVERLRSGKSTVGSVVLSAEPDGEDGDVTIRVSDDGRGVDEVSVRARAVGTDVEGADVHELLFAPGLTTADTKTELAGLGVGLSAVRDDLRAVGYDVGVSWRGGEGTTFTISKPKGAPARAK